MLLLGEFGMFMMMSIKKNNSMRMIGIKTRHKKYA